MNNFYDTSSLLRCSENLFEEENKVIFSSITLKELEHIKTASNKDENIKYTARQLLHYFNNHPDSYECIIYTNQMEQYINDKNLELNDDARILASAVYYKNNIDSNVYFYTNDLALKNIAQIFFDKAHIKSIEEDDDNYTGYQNIVMTEEDMAIFYSNLNINPYGLLENEYLNILDTNNNIVDTYCWTADGFRKIKYYSFTSGFFGEVKPKKGDIYQAMAADSLINNKITMLKGPAGSGKSYLSLGYLLYALEKGKIDKILVFCNPVATRGSARLGFYPGTRDEKLLDSQIGNFLSSKLGGRIAVENLMNTDRMLLLPFSDIRGFDTTGMRAGVYITEAQNLDIPLIKLALQRVGDDGIVILDGDIKSQVDLVDYEGNNNGMRRVSQTFRGHDIYGEITLQKIHRGKIAELAEEL